MCKKRKQAGRFHPAVKKILQAHKGFYTDVVSIIVDYAYSCPDCSDLMTWCTKCGDWTCDKYGCPSHCEHCPKCLMQKDYYFIPCCQKTDYVPCECESCPTCLSCSKCCRCSKCSVCLQNMNTFTRCKACPDDVCTNCCPLHCSVCSSLSPCTNCGRCSTCASMFRFKNLCGCVDNDDDEEDLLPASTLSSCSALSDDHTPDEAPLQQ